MGETLEPNEISDPDDFFNMTEDEYDWFYGQAQEGAAGLKDIAGQLANFKEFQQERYDPTEGFNFFLNNLAPGLQNLTMSATSPFNKAINQMAEDSVGNTRRQLDVMFGNQIGYGGEDQNRAARAIGQQYNQAMGTITGQQLGTFQQLAGIGLQQAPQQYQAANQMYNQFGLASREQRLNALQGAGSMYSNLMGNAASGMDASSNWYTPTYGDSDFDKYIFPTITELSGSILGGVISALSDERLKKNIIHIKDEAFKAALGIYPVVFKWKSTDELCYGVVAQELAEVHPELVLTNDNGYMMVRYDLIKEALNGNSLKS